MTTRPENASSALRKELEEACSDLNRILGSEAAITPEQLVAHFAVPEKRERLSEPGLSAEAISERLQEEDVRQQTHPHSSAELMMTGLNAFRKWALAGFSLAAVDVRAKRLAACKSCPRYADAPKTALYQAIGAQNICTVCGCSVDKKIRLSTEKCPSPDPENPGWSRWGEPL